MNFQIFILFLLSRMIILVIINLHILNAQNIFFSASFNANYLFEKEIKPNEDNTTFGVGFTPEFRVGIQIPIKKFKLEFIYLYHENRFRSKDVRPTSFGSLYLYLGEKYFSIYGFGYGLNISYMYKEKWSLGLRNKVSNIFTFPLAQNDDSWIYFGGPSIAYNYKFMEISFCQNIFFGSVFDHEAIRDPTFIPVYKYYGSYSELRLTLPLLDKKWIKLNKK